MDKQNKKTSIIMYEEANKALDKLSETYKGFTKTDLINYFIIQAAKDLQNVE